MANNQVLRVWVGGAVFALVAGCSSAPPVPVAQAYQQASLQLAQASQGSRLVDRQLLESVLQFYEQMDDRAGQWEANFKLAGWYMVHNDAVAALPYARRAEMLSVSLGQKTQCFASAIQLGQLTREQQMFALAASCAQTALEQAIVLTYQQQFSQAASVFKSLDAHQHPDEFGFLYYQYGKNMGDADAVLTALELYRQAGNRYGVVDSLFVAAQLAQQNEVARGFAERALRAAQHLQTADRSQSIETWLAALPDD